MPAAIPLICRRGITVVLTVICALFLNISASSAQANGEALFKANCATCHNPLKDATGPALQGVSGRAPSKDWIHNWVHNPPAVIASGDKYANALYQKWNKTQMTPWPNLKNEEIDAIIKYVEEYKAPVAIADGPTGGGGANTEDNTWLYSLITLALLILAIIFWRANSSLKRAAAEKEGQPVEKEIPIYRNKLVIAIGVIVLLCLGGFWMTNGAINMGRQQNYMPTQPIFYSHKVHAGINQINCLYCHAGAEKGRHAMVPSTNVCMNCHKQISSYTGVTEHPLVTAEGKPVNGTEQIQLLYKYAGWDPVNKKYNVDKNGQILATSPKWVKIHNLPDHVYFNHSQHVKVGQVQCQQCHGEIQEMDEVYQFSALSMGWCINCHRQTKVKFTENNYYSIFAKYQKEIKEGKRDGVTVEDIGGIECQKCHY